MNFFGSSDHSTISIFSPDNSLMTACTLVPFCPIIDPIGSTLSSVEETAILDREPGSRAIDLISTVPVPISGTSKVNNWLTIFG